MRSAIKNLALGLLLAFVANGVAAGELEEVCSADELTGIFSEKGGMGFDVDRAGEGDFADRQIHLKVTEVVADGPADRAGLEVGDGIVAVNGKEILRTPMAAAYFGDLHRDLEVGDEVSYRVLRDGEELDLRMVAEPRSEAAVRFYVLTHMMFHRCEGFEGYSQSVKNLPKRRS